MDKTNCKYRERYMRHNLDWIIRFFLHLTGFLQPSQFWIFFGGKWWVCCSSSCKGHEHRCFCRCARSCTPCWFDRGHYNNIHTFLWRNASCQYEDSWLSRWPFWSWKCCWASWNQIRRWPGLSLSGYVPFVCWYCSSLISLILWWISLRQCGYSQYFDHSYIFRKLFWEVARRFFSQ